MLKNKLLIAIYSSLLAFASYSQIQERPKIGLALSGGGVRGLAHIGILKAIDKAGLKIDFIAGTSMGAVVGGLYAVGYSADSIEKIALDEDWTKLIANKLPLSSISIEEKAEYSKYISEFEVKNGKFQLPSGLIQGQELTLELSRLFMPVFRQRDFKQFKIPFVCMATDLSTGQAVVLDSGNIVNAIRASMAISSVFTPVEINNRLLVDGGVVYNFPVEIAKYMGADYVIGVDIGEPLRTKTNINSLIDVFMQINSFADLKNLERQKEKSDLLITPNLHGFSGADFSKSDTIIKCGVITGNEYYEKFKKLKDSLDLLYPQTYETNKLPKSDTIFIDKVELIGNNEVSLKLINYYLRDIHQNSVTIDKINAAVKSLFGTRNFDHIGYELIQKDSTTTLKLQMDEMASSFGKIAVNYHTFLGPSVILNAVYKHKLFSNSKLLLSANIGEALRWKSECINYLGQKHKYFIQSGFYFNRMNFPIYQSDGALTNIYKQNYFALDFRISKILNQNMMVGLGIKGEHHIVNPQVGLNFLFKRANYTNLNYYVNFNFNTLNSKLFPRKGLEFYAELNYIGQIAFRSTEAVDSLYSILDITDVKTFSQPFQQIKTYLRWYLPLTKRITNIAGFHLGVTTGVRHRTVFNDFAIGGLTPLYRNNMPLVGFFDYEFFQPNAIIITEGLQWQMSKNVYLTGQFNVGSFQTKVDEYLKMIGSKDYLIFGSSLSLGFNTLLGPVNITLMKGSSFAHDIRFYLNIGHNF